GSTGIAGSTRGRLGSGPRRLAGGPFAGERVHDTLEHDRYAHIGRLGGDQEEQRQRDPPAKLPHIGQQALERVPFGASRPRRLALARRGNGRWQAGGRTMAHEVDWWVAWLAIIASLPRIEPDNHVRPPAANRDGTGPQ